MKPEYGLFYCKRHLRVGWISGQERGRCVLEMPGGEQAIYPAAQLLYRWEGEATRPGDAAGAGKAIGVGKPAGAGKAIGVGKPAGAGKAIGVGKTAGALEQLSRRLSGLSSATGAEMEAVHRKLPKGAEMPFARIARRVLPNHADGWRRARLYWGLMHHPRLFRHQVGGFVARGAAEQRRWETRRAETRAREARQLKAAQWREALERGERPRGKGAAEFLRRVESLLMEERRSPHWDVLAQPLGLRRSKPEQRRANLRGWLEVAGVWPGWPRMWLQWSGVAQRFPRELALPAGRLSRQRARIKGRSDFRKRPTYTIDVTGAKDLDDAITIIASDETSLLAAVHITQPSPSLLPGHPLFEEAARRASSLYTPGGIFPMFPAALSAGRYSLLRGREREVLSFILRLTEEGGELLEVKEGIVRITANLNYQGADARLLRKAGDWARLGEICASLQAGRIARGAQMSERVDVVIDASDPRQVKLRLCDRRGPAQRIVEELAVLLNREAGRYCREHALPAIYRVQPRSRGAGKGGRKFPRPASFSTHGAPHAGLACDRYIQITSPLRRFPDLVMQQQIAGHAIEGRVTYPDDTQLRAWARAADGRMAAHADLEARIGDYWKRVYMAQQSGAAFQGIVRRMRQEGQGQEGQGQEGQGQEGRGKNGPGRDCQGRVWLEEPRLLVDADLPPGAEVGQSFTFQVKCADPENHQLRVKVK